MGLGLDINYGLMTASLRGVLLTPLKRPQKTPPLKFTILTPKPELQ